MKFGAEFVQTVIFNYILSILNFVCTVSFLDGITEAILSVLTTSLQGSVCTGLLRNYDCVNPYWNAGYCVVSMECQSASYSYRDLVFGGADCTCSHLDNCTC